VRILIAGDWHSELHEEVMLRALENLGHTVEAFKWCAYFGRPRGWLSAAAHAVRRFQNKYLLGPAVRRLNQDLIAATQGLKPEMLFVYRGTHIHRETLRAIKAQLPNCTLVGYNNDDPFSPDAPRYLWRHFVRAVPGYDLMLAYRHANLREYRDVGAQRVELFRSWFVPERNHPVKLSAREEPRFAADVVFVGHYEEDQRLEYLEEIARSGIRLRLFGPGYDWDPVIEDSSVLGALKPVQLVWGEDYNRALCGAKIALCFLSKLNRDTYTRRCFEIPAAGTLMLSEYSDDLASLFREGVEADFFRSKDEMMEKIKYYLAEHEVRERVASAGQRRVFDDGHDVAARMRQLLTWVNDMKERVS
jgi:spore maturation protein CgeB